MATTDHPSEPAQPNLLKIALGLAAVGVLAWLMFAPRLSARRATYPRDNCASNLKQIGLAIAMYADHNAGRCPVDGDPPTLLGSLKLLSNHIGNAKVFFCPLDRRRNAGPESSFARLTELNISYSYVPNLMWEEPWTDSVVLLDRIHATEQDSAWPSGDRRSNHKGQGGNLLFTDGHVEFLVKLPSALKDKSGTATVLSP